MKFAQTLTAQVQPQQPSYRTMKAVPPIPGLTGRWIFDANMGRRFAILMI